MPPTRSTPPASIRGFTLMELLVVLMILGLMTSLVIPMIGGGGGAELRASARQVATALKATRGRAVNGQSAQVLMFDLRARTAKVPGESKPLRLPEGMALEIATARQEQSGEQQVGVRFFPDGGSTGGTVTLRNNAGSLAITVDWLTGQVRIREPRA